MIRSIFCSALLLGPCTGDPPGISKDTQTQLRVGLIQDQMARRPGAFRIMAYVSGPGVRPPAILLWVGAMDRKGHPAGCRVSGRHGALVRLPLNKVYLSRVLWYNADVFCARILRLQVRADSTGGSARNSAAGSRSGASPWRAVRRGDFPGIVLDDCERRFRKLRP